MEGLADLEERQIVEAARLVAGGGAQQAGEKRGAHVAHLGADRVLEPCRLSSAAEQTRRLGVDEAVGDAFVVAGRRDAATDGTLAGLRRGQDRAGDAGGAGQRFAFELGERRDPGDLFDEIGLALDVGAPGWRGDLETVAVGGHGEAEGGEDARLLGRRDLHADEADHAGGVERVGPGGVGDGAGMGDLGRLAAAEVEDEAGRHLDAVGRVGGIDAALEAVAGVGIDAETAPGVGGAHGVEPGRLDEDVGGLGGHAAADAAHDAADALGALGVTDKGFGAVEGVGLVVQRREPLAGTGEADGDGAAMHFGRVEDVERAGAVEGDEVGDVDQRRDRAQADGTQAVLEPLRRGTVFHAPDDAAVEDRAGLVRHVGCEVDADRTGERSGDRFDRRGDQFSEAPRGKVARHAGDA